MQDSVSTISVVNQPALDLATLLLQAGYQPGVPAGLTPESQAVDRGCCRRLRCAACGRRGMDYRPHYKGSRCRVLAVCSACGNQEER